MEAILSATGPRRGWEPLRVLQRGLQGYTKHFSGFDPP